MIVAVEWLVGEELSSLRIQYWGEEHMGFCAQIG